MKLERKIKLSAVFLSSLVLILSFQNCGKIGSGVGNQNMPTAVTKTTPAPLAGKASLVLKEYKHKASGKYFFTGKPADQTAVESSHLFEIKGTIKVFASPDSSTDALCRFFILPTHSHFYTANASECSTMRNNSSVFQYEEIEGYAALPSGKFPSQVCPLETVAVYRLLFSPATVPPEQRMHRFTGSSSVRQSLLASGKGWVDEGIAFCALEANTID